MGIETNHNMITFSKGIRTIMNNLHPTLGAWIHHHHASMMRKNQTKKDLFFLCSSPPPLNACKFGKKVEQ
jgi:hypothetical protein